MAGSSSNVLAWCKRSVTDELHLSSSILRTTLIVHSRANTYSSLLQ